MSTVGIQWEVEQNRAERRGEKGKIVKMDIRYSTNQRDVKRYTTEELRREFLIEKLFAPGEVTATYSHVDRIVVLGAMPLEAPLELGATLDCRKNFGVDYFLQRRELGIINIGGPGKVTADGEEFALGHLDTLYVSMGTREVCLSSENGGEPAKFYMCSTPAHKACPTTFISMEKAAKRHLGSRASSNERTINQLIHPDVLETCQLSMGLTQLSEGSVWNTMPSHTHERRMEVYTYFEIPEDQVVFHMMGQGQETRHIVMQNYEAVISPSWSIHAGAGTSNYTFIWAMGGENQAFDDMDTIPVAELR